jgi:heme ABC exporter ATP-binding subunit CcmA
LISIEGLTVRYGRTIALHAIDLELEPGITGVFGPNGSGKSTLLRTIAGLLRPVRGRVSFDGTAVRAADEDWRRRIGYAGHQPGLYEHLSVRENLELFARLNGAHEGAVDETLERIGLGDRADERVSSLSAGWQRRAGVARALVHAPQILLLDEPYANLDDESSDLISNTVLEWRNSDRWALVATHGARRMKAYADRGLVLRQGTVATYRPYRDV